MILYLAADLIWGTKIKATAQAAGVNARPVRTLEMLEARLADQSAEDPVRGVLLDLEAAEVALAMLARVKGAPVGRRMPSQGIKIVCWAPHVERELIERAKGAGADVVMTRGAFDARMEEVLGEMGGRD